MTPYKQILVAVDLSADTTRVINKAREIAGESGAELSLVHVMAPLAMGYTSSLDTTFDSLYAEATRQCSAMLLEIGAAAGIPEQRIHNLLGGAAPEVRRLASSIKSDLVIVGGHGKHGFELLLGSTSTGISHGLGCDLLIVYIPAA